MGSLAGALGGSMKYKYKVGIPALVYKCKESPHGFLGVIVERDALDRVYLIKDISLPDVDRWVREENILPLSFDRPVSLLARIRRLFK
jgi:hypothetical protein